MLRVSPRAAAMDRLQALAQRFNLLLFGGRLPLNQVRFSVSRAQRRLGGVERRCRAGLRYDLRLSELLFTAQGDRRVADSRFNLREDVLVHELVHLEQFERRLREAPHGPWFRARMRELGASPRATLDFEVAPVSAWLYRCPNGHELARLRRYGRQAVSCRLCDPRRYNPRYRMQLVGRLGPSPRR
ncbi:MAG: SprT-like domain-containing protein [Actinobacteria bacterium]|nr:SprT-like domain-containing protein [Actinomycetota bacterium]